MSDDSKNISLVNISAESLGDTAKEIYKDCLKPAAQATGKLVSLAPRGIRALLSPFETWIMNKEAALTETSKLVSEKLSSIPPEKIVTPEPYIAVPSLQALSYSIDNPDLRELFANLLASSMNTDTKEEAHPAFVEIIKQLSPIEAKIIKETNLLFNKALPCCNVRFQKLPEYSGDKDSIFQEIGEGYTVIDHLVIFDNFIFPNKPLDYLSPTISNLIRLGLCEIPYGITLTGPTAYDSYKNYPNIDLLREEIKKSFSSDELSTEYNVYFIQEAIRATSLGKKFYNFCVK